MRKFVGVLQILFSIGLGYLAIGSLFLLYSELQERVEHSGASLVGFSVGYIAVGLFAGYMAYRIGKAGVANLTK